MGNARKKNNMDDQSNRQPERNMESHRQVQNNAEVGAPSVESSDLERSYNAGDRRNTAPESRGSNVREMPRRDASSSSSGNRESGSHILDSDRLSMQTERDLNARDSNPTGSASMDESRSEMSSSGQEASLRDREGREEEESHGSDMHSNEARDESMEEQSWKIAKTNRQEQGSGEMERHAQDRDENSGELGTSGPSAEHMENRSGELNVNQHSSNRTPSGSERDARNKGSRKKNRDRAA